MENIYKNLAWFVIGIIMIIGSIIIFAKRNKTKKDIGKKYNRRESGVIIFLIYLSALLLLIFGIITVKPTITSGVETLTGWQIGGIR